MGVGLMILVLLIFMILGVPVAISLAVASALYLLTNGINLAQMVQELAVNVNSFALLAAPFFVLVGQLMNTGGITKRLFGFVKSVVGHIRASPEHAIRTLPKVASSVATASRSTPSSFEVFQASDTCRITSK